MFRIDLGKSQKRTQDGVLKDPISAYDELVTAKEELDKSSLALAALEESASIIISGSETAAAIKDVAGSDVAAVVAKESLRHGLTFIGQESLTEEVVASESATDPFEGVIAANESMLKDIWEKTKEYALKVWEWIRNLVMKAVDFIKSLIGKEGAYYKDLKELLDKLDKEGRTILNKDEFPETVRERLVEKVALFAAAIDKKFDGGVYKEIIDGLTKGLENTTKNDIVNAAVENLKTNLLENDDLKSVDEIAKVVANFHETITFSKSIADTDKFVKSFVEEIKDEYGEKDGENTVKITGYDSKKIYGYIITMSEEANAAVKNLGNKPNYEEAAKALDIEVKKGKSDNVEEESKLKVILAVLNKIKVKSFEYTVPKKEYENNADNIIPISYADAKDIVNTLEGKAKTAEKLLGDYNNKIEKAVKKVEKTLKTKVKSEDQPIKSAKESIFSKLVTLAGEIGKAGAKGVVATATEVVRPKFGDIIKESARLYEKP